MADPRALGHALLSPGPAPNGRDKVFDTLYGWLGGKPENRWAADKLTSALDWGTLGMLTGAYDGGKELAETGRPAALAMALMPGAKVAAPAAQAATQAAKKGIRAFHGSPHDFDRFDLSKIGTGEGAQAYGHGLYFADNEAVARSYKDKLGGLRSGFKINGKSYDPIGGNKEIARLARAERIDPAIAREVLAYHDKTPDEMIADVRRFPGERDASILAAAEWKRQNQPKTGGRMYDVNIKADPEDFLDWDKPLSQQSEKVKALFQNLPPETRGMELYRAAQGLDVRERPKLTGDPMRDFISQGWHDAGAKTGTKKRASEEALNNAGIPGIRYLDQGSRTAGEGSRNYVVFDDALIEILRKYGLLPPAGAAGLAAALQSSPADAAQ